LDLLNYYGFLLPHNDHDNVLLPLDVLKAQFKRESKNAECLTSSLQLKPLECFVHQDGTPSWLLLKMLRSVTIMLLLVIVERLQCMTTQNKKEQNHSLWMDDLDD
jgi:hypothetical protein